MGRRVLMRSLQQDVETLRRIPLFAGLPTSWLKLIAHAAETVEFEPGDVMVQEGQSPDAVQIIIDGGAEVCLPTPAGESRRLWTIGRHGVVGDTVVLCQGRGAATVRAKGRVVVFKISSTLFIDLIRRNPDLGVRIMTLLAQRLEQSTVLLRQVEEHREEHGPTE